MLRVADIHVGRQHIGKSANFPTAHGIGLAGNGKWPRAWLANAPREQMTVDDGIDLVRAIHCLVNTHGKGCDSFGVGGEEAVKTVELTAGQPRICTDTCIAVEIGRHQCFGQTVGAGKDET